VQRAVFAETLEAPPGTRVVYSDVGFLVLGWIVETLLGETLASAFAKRVAAPLGLQNTFFVDAAAPATTGAHRQAGARPCETLSRPFVATENCEHRPEINCGTVNDDNAWAVGGVAGHAGLFSTAREVAYVGQDWLSALLGRRALLRPATATYFATRDEIVGSTRALGWDTPSAQESSIGTLLGRGRRGAIGHLGFTGTSLWIDIDRELVCVLLTNRVHPSRANQAIKAFRPRFHDAVARGCELGSER
jgi:CubicO group peptidase (beta-lactamase class C family)